MGILFRIFAGSFAVCGMMLLNTALDASLVTVIVEVRLRRALGALSQRGVGLSSGADAGLLRHRMD
jgi:hypothetical protein